MISYGCATNKVPYDQDKIPSRLATLVSRLDSLSMDSTIELKSKSERFETFLTITYVASENDLIYLVRRHPNPVVKGYSYIGLLIIESKTADVEMKKHYSMVSVLEEDVERTFIESDVFMRFIKKRVERIKTIARNVKES